MEGDAGRVQLEELEVVTALGSSSGVSPGIPPSEGAPAAMPDRLQSKVSRICPESPPKELKPGWIILH